MNNRIPEFPPMYLEYLDQARRQSNMSMIQLGGTSGSGGGVGGPPGGFLGKLIQTQVAYDTTKAATTSGSSSLLDNLNQIRYLIANVTASASGVGGAGVAGRVAYWTSGSTLSSDGAFTWDTSAGRLGIGKLALTSGSMSLAGNMFRIDAPMIIDPTGAIAGRVLGYDGSKWVPTVSSGSSSSTTGSGVAGRVAYWDSGSVLGSDSGFTYDAANDQLVAKIAYFTQGLQVGGTIFGYPPEGSIYSSSQTEDVSFNLLTAGLGKTAQASITSGSAADATLTLAVLGQQTWNTGIDASDGGKYKIGTSTLGTNTALTLFPSALDTLGIGSKTFKLDANIELDPTGAISGNVLGYNGAKWVPVTSSGSGGGSGSVATDTIWDALGDLAAGTGANTAIRLAAGANGTILESRSTEPSGLKWVNAPAGAVDVIQIQVFS